MTNAARILHHAPSPLHANGANGGGSAAYPPRPNVETAAQPRRDANRGKKADVLADPLFLNGEAEADEQDGRFAGIDDAEQTTVFLAAAVEIAPKATANAETREFTGQVLCGGGSHAVVTAEEKDAVAAAGGFGKQTFAEINTGNAGAQGSTLTLCGGEDARAVGQDHGSGIDEAAVFGVGSASFGDERVGGDDDLRLAVVAKDAADRLVHVQIIEFDAANGHFCHVVFSNRFCYR